MLTNYIGIYSDRVISRKQNHAWNITLIDGEWTYIDPQKNVQYLGNSGRAESHYLRGFWSKISAIKKTYTFSDAYMENDYKAILPEGVDINVDTASSKIYYDEEYKYYLYKNFGASNDVNGLYKENRKTGERTCITTSPMILYDNISCEIIKDGNIIYFVGQDVKSIYSIKIDGTDEKLVYSTKVDGEYIGGVYSSDGYLCYSTFYPDQASNIRTTEKENILFKLQDTSSDYKIYTLDNDKQKYRLVYTKNKDGITIIKCIGIGNYFNARVTDMMLRKKENVLLECVGLTKRQICFMLILEGLYYWLIVIAILAVFGTGVLFVLGYFMKLKLSYFIFQYPLKAFLMIGISLLLFCICLPNMADRSNKGRHYG